MRFPSSLDRSFPGMLRKRPSGIEPLATWSLNLAWKMWKMWNLGRATRHPPHILQMPLLSSPPRSKNAFSLRTCHLGHPDASHQNWKCHLMLIRALASSGTAGLQDAGSEIYV